MHNYQEPELTVEILQTTLEAMRLGLPLARDHPLLDFISITGLRTEKSHTRDEVTIFGHLCQLIRQNLHEHRQLCRPKVSKGGTQSFDELAALKQDFAFGNYELEAWSVLFYRFVRIELSLSMSAIASAVDQSVRTLNRRQALGSLRLLHRVLQREQHMRTEHRQTILVAKLPSAIPSSLFGRELALRWAVSYLARESRIALCLQGNSGVGKSTFALSVAGCLIQNKSIHNIVWLTQPDVDPMMLRGQIAEQLGFLKSDATNFENALHRNQILVVLDNADALVSTRYTLLEVPCWLRSFRLLLITSTQVSVPSHPGYIYLPPLDRESALQAILAEYFIPDASLDKFVALFNALYDAANGNLHVLRESCVSAIRSMKRDRPVLDFPRNLVDLNLRPGIL